MTIRYAVTFEFLMKPPLTHRGTVAAYSVGTCASRAMKEAQRVLHPVNWSSCVFVALERLDTAEVEGDIEGGDGDTGEIDGGKRAPSGSGGQ